MPALPHLQPRETESPVSPEKRPYRLSLHDSSPRTSQQDEGQTRSSYNVNSSDLNLQENNLNFEGTNSLCFGETPHHFRNSLLPTPSPCRILKRTPRTQDNPGQPTWVDPLGVWLPNKKRWNQYETFTRHAHLLHRTSDMFLDPRPYIPRCSHERTLSALQRQRHRLETDEELKRQERNMRIIERVKQIRDMWDKWSNKADALGAEHKNRLNNFRKIRDDYTDPEEVIRKKREERIKHERELYEERERKKQEELEKKRFKIPKIIVTQYEEDLQQNEELEELSESKVTNSVNIPRASENEEDCVDAEVENRGRRGSNLEVPERESMADDMYYEENLEIENEQENCEHGNMGDNVEDGNFASLESHGNNFASLESNGNNFASLESHGNNLAVELENVVLEDKSPKSLGSVVESQLDSISEPGSVLLAQGSVSSTAEELNTQQRTGLDTSKKETETEANCNYSGNSGKLEKNGSEKGSGKGSTKGSESTLKSEEKQMDFLRPPHVSVVLGEIIPDDGSISDADDTASLMAAFTPVSLGVSNGIVPSDAMRASSVVDRYHVPSQARLNNTKEGKNGGAWKPKISDKKQFLEIDLGTVTNVMQVASQGYPNGSQKMQKKEKCWVESYTLSLSTDGSSWHQCTESGAVKVFKGNKDNNSVVLNSIPTPMEARFVRFIPQTWKNSIAMRVEVYGEVLEPELSSVTPPPYDRPVEAILEEEEEAHVKEFMCSAEKEQDFDEQNAWEECTVNSVVETASQIQGRVATVSQSSLLELTVQGEKQSSKSKRKPKKPKEEKHEEKAEKNAKKKKKKKMKEKKTKLPPVVSSLSALEDVEEEEDGHSSGDEQEEEEERFLGSPPLPEIPKRPDSVKRMPPAPKRSFSMFPVRKESQEEPKPRRRRAQTDDSIRNELQRQQLAEDRRHKLLAAMGKTKKEVQAQSPVFDDFGAYGGLDDFLEEYCIMKEGQAKHYRRIFNTYDDDKDGFLFAEDVLEALESVNSHLLSDSHLNYIYRVLELCDCSLDSGADFKLFSVIAAFSQRVAVLDEFAKILISNLDFKELDYKLQRAKRLFLCYVDEETKTISLEELMLGLTAGGLTADQKEQTLQVLGKTASLDFLDFLTYIPLFIHIHDHILQDPVGTVVYRSYLTA